MLLRGQEKTTGLTVTQRLQVTFGKGLSVLFVKMEARSQRFCVG